ncbi:MAG: aminoacetone oxidase family FAD-binding enzyme, partial [Candidatus Izemoplasmatales bacterium]
MKQSEIGIIGGGAAGIMAAIIAARNLARVAIFEKNNRIGRKILATGNGRANYTNINGNGSDYNDPLFADAPLMRFSPSDAIAFFKELGIEPLVEDKGRAYPLSEQASSIVDVFLYELDRLGVNVMTETNVIRIDKVSSGFNVYDAGGGKYHFDKIIVTTGGKAMPTSGSNGSGYQLVKDFGHETTRIFPALVKLRLESPYLKHLDGVKIQKSVELLANNKVIDSRFGDVLFTSYGISGPTILDLSRLANTAIDHGEEVKVRVILVPKDKEIKIDNRFFDNPMKPIDLCLVGLIHKRLISPLLKEANIVKQNAPASTLSRADIERITALLYGWEFVVTGTKSFEDAQVT